MLDEPTSYLDVRYKLEFLSILQRMKREKNLTVIMSLHELELAERVSDKILCINGAIRGSLRNAAGDLYQRIYLGSLLH